MDGIATQIMMKLAANPRTAEWLKDPSFMTKLQMLKTNPQMFPVLMQQDPRLGEAFNMLIGDFADITKGAGGFPDKNKAEGDKTSSKMEEEKEEEDDEEEFVPPPQPPKKEEAPKKTADSHLPEHERVKNEGNEQYKKKNFEKALELYNKAIQLEPTEVLYYNNKAAAYIELKQLDAALETIEIALKVAVDTQLKDFQKHAKLFARKASIFAKKGDLGASLEWYQKSLLEDMNPKVKVEMKQIEKQKKEIESKAYINPVIAEEHNEKGNLRIN